jgi:RNA polymerase sigma-70 factor (family 1)
MIENETEYILELQNDSNEAFEYLYHRYAPRLYGFVHNLTKSSDLAEEVVQETFIKIWENRGAIRPEYSFKSYLFMIARNHVINVFRRQTIISTLEESDAIQNNIAFSENNTGNLAELNELKIYIEKAKKHLTPRQCEIFELSKEKGFSNQEIADKLKITNQSVKNQLSASLHILQSYFNAKMWALLPLLYFYMDNRSEY